MAKIGGITIKIGADTSELNRSLKQTDNEIKNTQRSLADVEKKLKLDPTDVELLEQKAKLLSNAVKDTSDKLEALKKAEESLKDSGIDENSTQFLALQREIKTTEKALEQAKEDAESFDVATEKLAANFSKVADKASDIQKKTEKASKVASGILAGVAGVATVAVKNFAEFEQLAGGVETLYGDAANTIIKNADNAFKTAGLSANEYLETSTSFAASLINSVGGNTQKAAELADMAITDMADNSNKLGTSIESLQNAYRGFAKGTFNMLDNLQLGFSGTKEGMQELLDRATELSGIKFNIDSYADIVQAINVVQKDLGIAGATALEAETTISGSLNAAKSALSNFLTDLATGGADVEESLNALIDAVGNLISNITPVLETIWENIPLGGQVALVITAIVAAISPIAGLIANITLAIGGLITVWPKLQAVLTPAHLKIAAIAAALLVLAGLISAVVNAWGDMSGWERAIAVIGTLTSVALGAAIAMGAFESATTMGLAAAGIVAGVAATIAAVESAKRRAQQEANTKNIPMMANGGVLSNGSAIVGEAGAELLTVSNGRATVQPLTNNNTTNVYNTSQAPLEAVINLNGTTVARAIFSDLQREEMRRGVGAITV